MIESHPHDVLIIGAGRGRPAGGGGVRDGRPLRRRRLQVAARQGPHRHGRGRHGRRAWPTWTIVTRGPRTSATRWWAAASSTTRAWRSCTPGRPRTASASWRPGARSSTAPRTAASCSGPSVATPTRASPTSATAPVSSSSGRSRTARWAWACKVYPETIVTRLARDASGVLGAIGYRRLDGRPVAFPARAVILATGGAGRAFVVTSNSWESSGDGYALA